ncbi:MAG: DNA polymerase I [bacterium]|nr:DNA polymerase I [bacterium]
MSLILVDGSALFYRSHYAFAKRPLTAPNGELTSVVYGFLSGLLRLIEENTPEHLAVVFDVRGKNFRHEMFPEYKANRKPMPEELAGQLPRLREVLEAWGIAILEQQGVEADDVMGSVAKQTSDHADKVWFYTGDKDFMQLLDDRIGMLKPQHRGSGVDSLTGDDVLKKFNLDPVDLIHVFALSGDAADNIPGAPGIGEKTALKLIREFGSLEGLYESLEASNLTPRLKRVLSENKDQVFLSRDLFIIKKDLQVDLDWEQLKTSLPVGTHFMNLLQELGLKRVQEYVTRLAKQYPHLYGSDHEKTPEMAGIDLPIEINEPLTWLQKRVERSYRLLDSSEKLQTWLESLDPQAPLAVDTETDSLRPDVARLVGVCLAGFDTAGNKLNPAYIPVRWRSEDAVDAASGADTLFPVGAEENRLAQVRELLGPVLADARSLKVGQNLKYDEWILLGAEMPLGGPRFDTMLASYVLDPGRRSHGLDDLVLDHCDHQMMAYKELFAPRDRLKDILAVDADQLAVYAAEDADFTLQLFEFFQPELDKSGMKALFYDLEMPVMSVLLEMERTGIYVDKKFLSGLKCRFEKELSDLNSKIHELAGEEFNIQSPKQLSVILFEKLGLKPIKKTTTGWSTDVSVLTALADEHPLPAMILEYRQVAKLQNTYVDVLPGLANPATGLIHTSYNQAVAATGRLSSSNPNLQNIPIRTELGRLIRQAFVPRKKGNIFLSADYSQVELRLLAHLAQDPGLLGAFRDGVDVHQRTAALIGGIDESDVTSEQRSRAKAINFGVIYGMGARALARQIKVTVKEASAFIETYFETYPGVREFIDKTKKEAAENQMVETLLGRRRLLPDINSDNPRIRSFQERVAVNTPIQGTAADLIKLAMIRISKSLAEYEGEALLLLQVHDELVLELPESEKDAVSVLVQQGMEGALELDIPLLVDVNTGANWSEAH